MSVILDALERAKQDRARRKDGTRPALPIIELSDQAQHRPASPASPTTDHPGQPRAGITPLLTAIALGVVLLLGLTMGLVVFLLLERNQTIASAPQTQSPATVAIAQSSEGLNPPTIVQAPIPTPTAHIVPQGVVMAPGPAVAELPVAVDPYQAPLGPDPRSQTYAASIGATEGIPNPAASLPSPSPMLPKLGSIICDERGCVAMLNGRITRAGDHVGEFEVLSVSQDFVLLRDAAGRTHNLSQGQ
jgi:hypothetical protein